MARRQETYTVPAPQGDEDNRDAGKTYLVTEMPASQGEEWAFRALSAMARGGVQLPDEWEELSLPAIAAMSFSALAGAPWQDVKPLLDEMMGCVQVVVDPQQAAATTRKLVESDIEEIGTRLVLRRRVFELHTSFFKNAVRSA